MSYFVLPFQERVGQYKVKCVLHNENVNLFSNSFSACTGEIVFFVWEDFNGHIERRIDGFEDVHGGYEIGKRNVKGRRLLEFSNEKQLCVANTWFEKKDQRKVTYSSMGENETEIDFVLVKTIESIYKT